jgi:hypothetical protein
MSYNAYNPSGYAPYTTPAPQQAYTPAYGAATSSDPRFAEFQNLRNDQVVQVNVRDQTSEIKDMITRLIKMNEDVSNRLRNNEIRAQAIENDLNAMAASMGSVQRSFTQTQGPQAVTVIDPQYWREAQNDLSNMVNRAQFMQVQAPVHIQPQQTNTMVELEAFLALFNMSKEDIRHHAKGTTRTKLEYLYDLPAWSGLIQWAHQPVGEGTYEMVEQMVEVPVKIPVKTVEKVIERPTPVVVEKVVEKPAQVVMMERVVEKPVITERIIEQPAVRLAPAVERVPQVVMTERVVQRPVQVVEQVVEKVPGGLDASHLSSAGPYVQTGRGYVQPGEVTYYEGSPRLGSPGRVPSPTRGRLIVQ